MNNASEIGALWVKQLIQSVTKTRNSAAENLLLLKPEGDFAAHHRTLIEVADRMLAAAAPQTHDERLALIRDSGDAYGGWSKKALAMRLGQYIEPEVNSRWLGFAAACNRRATPSEPAPASDTPSGAVAGCDLCGCVGLHACPGAPMKEWTPEKIAELHAVLAEYETEPVHAKRTEVQPRSMSMCASRDYMHGWNDCLKAVQSAQQDDKASEQKSSLVSDDRSNEIAAIMPNGAAVTNVYEAYDAGYQHCLKQSAQQAGDALDAARYRWIRENSSRAENLVGYGVPAMLDAEIDAILAASAKGE